jgi:pimeloyl-ACP methyl ester carboxylesterase
MQPRVLFLALALIACAPAAQTPLPSPIPDPASLLSVNAERLELPGFDEPNTPNEFDKTFFVRYSAAKTGKARAVIVLMPGLLGGAANFDRLARGIVSKNPSLEVWAIDRRSNALEDQTVLREALNQRDPLIAWRYFVRDAGQSNGFRARDPKDLKFMGFWGLKVHLEDLRRVLQRARDFGDRVILGGHSLGAVLVSLYAGWDFDGTPGARDIDGLLLLDGVAGRTGGNGNLSQRDYQEGTPGPFGIRSPGRRELEAGTATPYFSAFGFDPSGLAKLSAAALLASLAPNEDSPGGIVLYRASNLAAGLIGGDDDYALVNAFSVAAGRADNADVAINGLSLFTGSFALSVTGPAAGATRVEWAVPTPNDPKEVTDPIDFATRFYNAQSDFQEWYFPTRLTLDISAVGLEAPAYARNELRVWHVAQTRVPMLAVIGGRGIVTDQNAFAPLEQKMNRTIEVRNLPAFTHLDVLAARANPLVDWVIEFSQKP